MTSVQQFTAQNKLLILMIGLAFISMLMPDLALANDSDKYNFGPSDEVQKGFSESYSGWWGMLAEGAMWGSIAALIILVAFFKGQYWYFTPIVFLIGFFGQDAVESGIEKANLKKPSQQQGGYIIYEDRKADSIAKFTQAQIDALS